MRLVTWPYNRSYLCSSQSGPRASRKLFPNPLVQKLGTWDASRSKLTSAGCCDAWVTVCTTRFRYGNWNRIWELNIYELISLPGIHRLASFNSKTQLDLSC